MAEPKDRLDRLRAEVSASTAKRRAPGAEQIIKSYRQDAKLFADFYGGEAELDSKLAIAVSRGDAEEATRFIAQGADVNLQQEGRLPLIHEAIGFGYKGIVEAMLASGRCDLTVRDFKGRLPSDVADTVARDCELADRLAEEQARQFEAKKMDPRRPDNPDYGNWKWQP